MVDTVLPVAIPIAADDLITAYGAGTAVVQLAYGTASDLAGAATAPKTVTTGKEYYDFALTGVTVDTYFRWRVGGTTFHDWSPIFQAPIAYATRQEFLRGMDLPDDSRYDEIDSLLVEATDYITTITGGRSFFRDPVGTGTTTKTLDIKWSGQSRLSLARGTGLDIISLSTVGIAQYTGATYDTVATGYTGYYLEPDVPLPGHPYTDLVLSDLGTLYSAYPNGRRAVQLVGAFGWETVPNLVRRATVDLVRYWWNSRSGDGDPVGMTAFGSPVFGPGIPRTVRDLARSDYAWRRWVG